MARSASPKKPVKKVAKKSSKKSASATTAKKKAAKPAAKPAKKAKAAKAKPKKGGAGEEDVTIDRRRSDRRDDAANTKAADAKPAETKAPAPAKLERREKVNRRRQIDPTTCERDYTDAEVEFMNALDEYKRKSGRMFPTCSEVLEVIRDIGYVQLTPAEKAARDAQAVEADPAAEEDARAESDAEQALELSDEIRVEDEADAEV